MNNVKSDARELRLAWINRAVDLYIERSITRTAFGVATSISVAFDWENPTAEGAPLVGTHGQVAAMCGTSKRTMGRAKASLAEAGLIWVDHRGRWFIPADWFEGASRDD